MQKKAFGDARAVAHRRAALKNVARYSALSAVALALAACISVQEVQPSKLTSRSVCVIRDPDVIYNFDTSLVTHLRRKGLSVTLVEPAGDATSCTATVLYTANWEWDFAMYMRYAKISLLEGGRPAGQAVYRSDGLRFDKWVNADEKIGELVDELFPQ